jgi:hypothetical protein
MNVVMQILETKRRQEIYGQPDGFVTILATKPE